MGLINFFKNIVRSNPVVKSVGVYTAVNFLGKGISFLLLFIYTQPRYISPDENGLLNLFASATLFLMPFMSMGILQSTGTDFYKLDKKAFSDFFTTSLLLPLLLLVVFVAGFFVSRHWLQQHYGFPAVFVLLIPLVTFLTYINEQYTLLIRVNNELRRFAAAGIAKMVLEFGLSAALVVFFAMRWQGRLTGILCAYLLLGISAFVYFRQKGYLSGRIRKTYIRSELLYAVPIIVMQVSIFVLNTADKFILATLYRDNGLVGVYSVAGTFVSVITIFCSAYLGYLFPAVYKQLSAPVKDYRPVKKGFITYALVMLLAAVVITGAIPVLYRLFISSHYHPALDYYYLLAAGAFIWAITYYFYVFLLYYKQKRTIMLLALITIPVSFCCIYWFAKLWGGRGAAWGVFISYAASFALTCFLTRRYIKEIFSAGAAPAA